jgi:Argininosuccinate lyase
MKSLPLAYNKDLQEDKEGVFDTVKTILPALRVFNGMLTTVKVKKENMYKATTHDFSNATELADYLATKGVPFRQAHGIVGELVLKGLQTGKNLQDISMAEFKQISPLIEEDVYEKLKPEVAVERRNSFGGTGFKQVQMQIDQARSELNK